MTKAAENGDPSFFLLPETGDYAALPQDPSNRITNAKVELGKLLFFETGIATNPAYPNAKGTYSCATCHVPSAGFRPGSAQGVADGGLGFGHNGEGRTKQNIYEEWELDVQSVRPLSVPDILSLTVADCSTKAIGYFFAQDLLMHECDMLRVYP